MRPGHEAPEHANQRAVAQEEGRPFNEAGARSPGTRLSAVAVIFLIAILQ